jgi:hypothetical protein
MILHVKKKPDAHTLAVCVQADGTPAPEGWEAMAVPEFEQWRDAELAAGWAPPPPPPAPPQVPWAISNADLRRQLARAGINPKQVLNYLDSLPEGSAKWEAIADWEYANYFERSHPMLAQLAPVFGLTEQAVDAMFLACREYPRG